MRHLNAFATLLLACSVIPAVSAAELPVPTGVTAEATGNDVKITWAEVAVPDGQPTVETFESYDSYSTEGIGGWTFVDVDGEETYAPSGYLKNLYGDDYLIIKEGESLAWMVYSNELFATNIFKPRSADNKKVLLSFFSYGAAAEDWAISPKLNGEAQKISFYATGLDIEAEILDIYYSSTGTDIADFKAVAKDVKVYGDWTKLEYDLPEGALYFAIRYTAESDEAYGVAIDDVTFFAAESSATELLGYNIYRDGKKINAEPVATTAFTDKGAAYEDHFYKIAAVFSTGESDMSKPATFKASKLLAPTALTGSTSGSDVVLSWTAPATSATTESTVTESFEALEPYISEGIGDWTMINVDEEETYAPSGYLKDPYGDDYLVIKEGESLAWIVYSNKLFGTDIFPERGDNNKQVLVSFFSYEAAADNWAVSPRLNGKAQTISFYAVALDSYAESLEVYYSTTGTEIDDFKPAGNAERIYNIWTKCEYQLPEGTIYFAIRYTAKSDNAYGVAIDDVSYMPETVAGPELKGYNVYRDGIKLNAEPMTATTYTDGNAADQDHSYAVSAVYDCGESAHSESYDHTASAIDSAIADSYITVKASNGILTVNGATTVKVYAADGRCVSATTGDTETALPAGVYIIKADSTTAKVII